MRLCVGDAGAPDVSGVLINIAYAAKFLKQSVMRHTFIDGAEDSHLNIAFSYFGIGGIGINPLIFPHWNSSGTIPYPYRKISIPTTPF